MVISTLSLERVFEHGALRLPDPDPGMTPEAVRDLFATQYPELANASIAESVRDGQRVVAFTRSIGKKG